MIATTAALDAYYPDSHKRFLNDTEDHTMTIVHDDGLYRHVQFRGPAPHAWSYWFDLITWPGSLVIRGDMGTFGFSRIEDMTEFFTEGYINPGYWAEKLHMREGYQGYDEKVFTKIVTDWWNESKEDYPEKEQSIIWSEIQSDVLEVADYEHEAKEAINSFESHGFRFYDWYEHDFTAYTIQYLWCCHAVREGLKQYKATKRIGGAS